MLRRLGAGSSSLPVVQGKGGFVAGLAVGAIVSAACVIVLLKPHRENVRRQSRRTGSVQKLTETVEGMDYDQNYRRYRLPVWRRPYLWQRQIAGKSAATAKGWQVKVETQGSIGIENELSADDVANADMVILTKDIGIKFEERFCR